MNYSTVYVGMDVHEESFSFCCYTNEKEQAEFPQKVAGHYSKVLNHIEAMRFHYGDDVLFICGYEAGCLGFTLQRQLASHGVKCDILAPTTMPQPKGKKIIKTDKRDAKNIARCLAHHDYSPVHVPTEQDEQTKEYIRMRDDHKLAFKKIKQQILAFCLRHNYLFDGTSSHWTQAHLKWLYSLKPGGLYEETLKEYLLTYEQLAEKNTRLDQRIEELASEDPYKEKVSRLSCFIGVKTATALAVLTEVGDFKRFASAPQFASYIGLTPGEDSSGDKSRRLGITKAGNRHVRMLLVEAAQSIARGRIGFKSKALKSRQEGNLPEVILYADKANERLRRRYYRMVLRNNKKPHVAKTAIARELACFMWGMLTDKIGSSATVVV